MAPSTSLPTTSDLDVLANALDTDGFEPHESQLSAILAVASTADLQPGTLAVLADAEAPTVARSRAFGRLARTWPSYESAIRDGETTGRPMLALLDAWNTHEDLRSADASVADLASSRLRLDQARVQMQRAEALSA